MRSRKRCPAHLAIVTLRESDHLLGAQTDLLALAKEVAELKRVHDVGGDEPTLRDKPRWQVNQELRSSELRQGAEKPMLRPWEEEALPLVRPHPSQTAAAHLQTFANVRQARRCEAR